MKTQLVDNYKLLCVRQLSRGKDIYDGQLLVIELKASVKETWDNIIDRTLNGQSEILEDLGNSLVTIFFLQNMEESTQTSKSPTK